MKIQLSVMSKIGFHCVIRMLRVGKSGNDSTCCICCIYRVKLSQIIA